LLTRFKVKPPEGAAHGSVTVPVLDVPPATLVGERVKLGSATVTVVLASTVPKYDALIEAV
jgi:hypothetical protein